MKFVAGRTARRQTKNSTVPCAAGYAVAEGLPYDEALRAITLSPAEMFGLGDQLGSLDIAKTANVAKLS